jgi:two-component system chemotaxis response regulator CheY
MRRGQCIEPGAAGGRPLRKGELTMDQPDTEIMQPAASESGTADALTLAAVLDLAAAPDLLAALRSRFSDEAPLRLDAADVGVLTLPCAQIILSAIQTSDHVTICNPSDAFVSAFGDLALDLPQDRITRVDASDDELGESDEGSPPANAPSECASDEPGLAEEPLPDRNEDPEIDQPDTQAMTKRILTIDDSKTMRDMLLLTLTDAGFEVLQGVDGQDGLDVLGEQRVDVIITDINMPRMDGYEVIRQLRSNPCHKTTPILVLTTESDTQKKSLARDAGATGWMVKPFDPEGLVAVINKVSP